MVGERGTVSLRGSGNGERSIVRVPLSWALAAHLVVLPRGRAPAAPALGVSATARRALLPRGRAQAAPALGVSAAALRAPLPRGRAHAAPALGVPADALWALRPRALTEARSAVPGAAIAALWLEYKGREGGDLERDAVPFAAARSSRC